jgi:hypothetical protein
MIMKWMMTRMLLTGVMTAAAGAGIGCATDKSSAEEFFPPDGPDRRVNQFVNVQANNGAKEDATLRPAHFDGAELNPLGAEKLARMVPEDLNDAPTHDVVVYLNLAEGDATTTARRDNVMKYLRACGLTEAQVELKAGANPAVDSPAASHLARMNKTESGGADAAGQSEDLGGSTTEMGVGEMN